MLTENCPRPVPHSPPLYVIVLPLTRTVARAGPQNVRALTPLIFLTPSTQSAWRTAPEATTVPVRLTVAQETMSPMMTMLFFMACSLRFRWFVSDGFAVIRYETQIT